MHLLSWKDMIDNVTPPSSGSGPSPSSAEGPSASGSSQKGPWKFHAKPMTFLGMYFDSEEATKLWTILLQNFSREIERDTQKAVAAIRKMR